MHALGLKFISGKYKGAAFAVPDGGELIIGRSGDRDIVLEEEMVSRQHAKVRAEGSELLLIDLGSTNGTFVNGEKVRRIALQNGDRLLIGTSIARIVPSNELGGANFAENTDTLRNLMQDISQKNLTNTAMKGSLDDLPLPDLVQLFMNNLRNGDLRIYSASSEGHIFFHEGRVEFASIEGIPHLPPRKAFCRIVGWTIGNFEMFPLPENPSFSELIVESTESLLADAVRHGDEVQRLKRTLPSFQETLIIPRPLRARLSRLEPEELDTLQLLINHRTIQDTLDHSHVADHTLLNDIARLLHDGYMGASAASTVEPDSIESA